MRRISLNIFTHALMLAALLAFSAAPAIAQVSVSLPAVTAVAGESGTIDLTVGDLTGENVISYQFTIEYDPAVVDLTGATAAGTISEGIELSVDTSDANSITVAAAGVSPLSGSGTLVSFSADFVGAGQSPLTLTGFQFNEGTPAATVTDGLVTVPNVVVAFGEAEVTETTVSIPINTTSSLTGEGILSYQFTVTYDPAIINLTGFDAAGTLSEGMTIVPNAATANSLTIAAAGTTPLEGEGTLINLTGTPVAEGTTTLTFTAFQFNEGTPIGGGNPADIEIQFGGQEGSAESPLEIPVAMTPPMIDGEMDAVWADFAKQVSMENVVNGAAPVNAADLSGDVWVMYDASNLYVLYNIRDDSLINDSPNSWEDDAVDLYIDGGNEHSDSTRDANDAQYEFSWGDDANAITGGTQGLTDGVEYAWTTTVDGAGDTTGYYIEAVVPWSNFGLSPSGNMEMIGIEFMVNDDDPPGGATRDTKLAWFANEDNAWQWSHVLGYAVLVGTPPPVGSAGTPLEIPTTPGPPKIDGVIDLAWAEHGSSVSIGNTVSGAGTEPADDVDLSGEVWFMYDKGNLYVLYDVNDANLINDSPNSWEDDAVDLYIDAGNEHTDSTRDANDAQYEFSWGDDSLAVTGSVQGNDEDVRYAWSTKTNEAGDTLGYIIEAQVPWKNFSDVLNPSGQGELIGIEFMINDDDPPGGATRDTKMAWYANEDNAWQWSHVLGYAKLVGDPIGSGDPWAPYEIMHTDSAPELDGQREATWDQAHRLELNKWSGDMQPTDLADLNPSAELLFDSDYLYVYYQTADEALFNDSGNTWQDDSFDLDIDAGNEKTENGYDDNDAAFEFGYNATEVTGNAVPNFSSGVEFVSVETADGYAVEARVPWANFDLRAPDGALIGLEIKANDDDLGGDTRDTKYGWYEGTDNAWQWAHVFGTARLVGGSVAAEPDGEMPERFAIESVYPNPFNPSTTAVVSVREVGDYDVRIYNVLGQLIEKRMITAQIPGRMEVSLDFGRFASGLYMISVKNMQTGKIATAKAILTK